MEKFKDEYEVAVQQVFQAVALNEQTSFEEQLEMALQKNIWENRGWFFSSGLKKWMDELVDELNEIEAKAMFERGEYSQNNELTNAAMKEAFKVVAKALEEFNGTEEEKAKRKELFNNFLNQYRSYFEKALVDIEQWGMGCISPATINLTQIFFFPRQVTVSLAEAEVVIAPQKNSERDENWVSPSNLKKWMDQLIEEWEYNPKDELTDTPSKQAFKEIAIALEEYNGSEEEKDKRKDIFEKFLTQYKNYLQEALLDIEQWGKWCISPSTLKITQQFLFPKQAEISGCDQTIIRIENYRKENNDQQIIEFIGRNASDSFKTSYFATVYPMGFADEDLIDKIFPNEEANADEIADFSGRISEIEILKKVIIIAKKKSLAEDLVLNKIDACNARENPAALKELLGSLIEDSDVLKTSPIDSSPSMEPIIFSAEQVQSTAKEARITSL